MPASPNILLQTAAQAKAQAASAKSSAVAAEPGDKASSFAQVFADQGPNKPSVTVDNSAKPARDKVADNSGKKDLGKDQSAAPEPAVADSGKALPADKPATAAADDKTATDDETADTAPTPVVDTAPVDPALMAAVEPVVTAPVVAPRCRDRRAT